MNRTLIKEVIDDTLTRGGNKAQAVKQNRAYQILVNAQRGNIDFTTMADAFAIYAAHNGHRVLVDGTPWIPPSEGDVQ